MVGIEIFYLFCSCDLDLDRITFIYLFDPYSLEMYPVLDVQILTSYIKALESYCLTDRQTEKQTDRHNRNYIPCHFAGGQ